MVVVKELLEDAKQKQSEEFRDKVRDRDKIKLRHKSSLKRVH